ncbi:hypothetical protein P4319_27365 [Bacillus wiedmannii]|nr:hypothetical protein [Bacillus wiedmannii]
MQSTIIPHSKRKKKWIIIGVIALIVIVAVVNIFVMQGKNKGASTTADAVSGSVAKFEKT